MGGASGKMAKLLSGDASQDFLEKTFKSLDKDNNHQLDEDELQKLVEYVMVYLAKEDSVASTNIPFSEPLSTFSHWNAIQKTENGNKIVKEIVHALIFAISGGWRPYVLEAEFTKFDWGHFVENIEKAKVDEQERTRMRLQREKEEKEAEERAKQAIIDELVAFEADLPNKKFPETLEQGVEYNFFVTKLLNWPNNMTKEDITERDLWIKDLNDPRLKDIPTKMLIPVKCTRKIGSTIDLETTISLTILGDKEDKKELIKLDNDGKWSFYFPFSMDIYGNFSSDLKDVKPMANFTPPDINKNQRVFSLTFLRYRPEGQGIGRVVYMIFAGLLFLK